MHNEIIKTQMLGNTKICICTDYAVKTEEERMAILTELKHQIYEITRRTQ